MHGQDAALLQTMGVGPFDRLYREHYAPCLRLARQIVRDHHLAEDVVQDVFLMLWRTSGGTYRASQAQPGRWLRSVVRHRAIDAVRKSETRRRVARRLASGAEDDSTDLSGVHDAVWQAVRTQQLVAALVALVPAQREVLRLAYAGALTQLEIAAHLDVPLGTVKTRTRAVLRVLRTALADLDRDPTRGEPAAP